MADAFAPGMIAARLTSGEIIYSDDVERFVTAGPRGVTCVPPLTTAEGRQLRRWALQVMLGELAAQTELGQRAPAAAADDLPTPARLRAEVGSICATVLSRSPAARALLAATEVPGPALVPTAEPRHQDMLRRRQFELRLGQLIAERAVLAQGWHHPGDGRFAESAHTH